MSFKNEIKIGEHLIGENNSVFIIAEMSANHGQDLSKAKELVYAAKESGADAIKLQTYRADTLTMRSNQDHFFINDGPWKGQYLYDLYEHAYMPWEFHEPLFELASSLGITCFSSPFDFSAVDLLEQFDPPAYKIASPELIDHELIRYVAKTGKPIILSTGGATLTEISEAVDVARKAGVKELCILKCTSTYPAPPESINLRTIGHLAETFGCPVGLSDHTLGNAIPIASVAAGAQVIEKHFVLDKKDETADSFFSMTPNELKSLVSDVRQVEAAMGKIHYPKEPSNKRRCVYAAKNIEAGHIITRDDLIQMRPGEGEIQPKEIPHIIGKKAKKALEKGAQLSWSDFA